MLMSSVTVFSMLLVLWWGIYGFICCAAFTVECFTAIHMLFGRKALCVALILTGLLVIKIGNNYEAKEKNTVEAFMTSWKSDSDNNGERYIGMEKWEYLVDWGRSNDWDVPDDTDFSTRTQLVDYDTVKHYCNTALQLPEDVHHYIKAGNIGIKVFKVRAKLRDSEISPHYYKEITFYVATDNKKIVKMRFN